MGNHDIPCDYCGLDTRGLMGVRGCLTDAERVNCHNWRQSRRRLQEPIKPTDEPADQAFDLGKTTGRQTWLIKQLRSLADPMAECMSDKTRLDLMIKLIGEL